MAAYQFGSSASITMMNAESLLFQAINALLSSIEKTGPIVSTNSNKKDLSTVELGISHNLLLSDF
jgi:hypothetical protein